MVEITNGISHYAGIFWMPLAVKKDPWVVPHWIPEMSRNKSLWIVFLDLPSKLVVQACMFIWSHMELHMELHMACYSCKNMVMSSHQMATYYYYSYILLCIYIYIRTHLYIYICIYLYMYIKYIIYIHMSLYIYGMLSSLLRRKDGSTCQFHMGVHRQKMGRSLILSNLSHCPLPVTLSDSAVS